MGLVFDAKGLREEAVRAQQEGLDASEESARARRTGCSHSGGQPGDCLAQPRGHSESLTHVDRAITLLENGLGRATRIGRSAQQPRRNLERVGSADGGAPIISSGPRIIWERELGMDSRFLAYGLTGIGRAILRRGRRQVRLRRWKERRDSARPRRRTKASRPRRGFALARALWESSRDRDRAGTLAEQAQGGLRETEESKRSALRRSTAGRRSRVRT